MRLSLHISSQVAFAVEFRFACQGDFLGGSSSYRTRRVDEQLFQTCLVLDSSAFLLLCQFFRQNLFVIRLDLPLVLFETLQIDVEQRCDLVDDKFDLFLAELHRLVVAAQLDNPLVRQRVVVLAHEDVSPCELVELPDTLAVIPNYEGGDPVRNRDEGVRSRERIHLKLLLELPLLLCLLLEGPGGGLCRHRGDAQMGSDLLLWLLERGVLTELLVGTKQHILRLGRHVLRGSRVGRLVSQRRADCRCTGLL